jgi:hypothetical protein
MHNRNSHEAAAKGNQSAKEHIEQVNLSQADVFECFVSNMEAADNCQTQGKRYMAEFYRGSAEAYRELSRQRGYNWY